MEFISISITCVALVVTVVFGYLQIVVPFIRKEVRWSRRFPYIESAAAPRRRRGRRKPRRRWVIPVSAVAVVIVAAILFRVLLLQAAELPRKPIAVMTFQNLTGEAEYDYLCKAIPNLLITNLEQSDRLQVMTWERMHDLLKQLDKADLAMIDEETGFELCRMDDVNTIVTGSFTRAGDVFVIDLRVLEVSSKKLLKTTRSQGDGVASILKVQVDELSRDIARNVSLFERTVAPTEMQIMEVTTNSMEAYNYFLRGREDYDKHYYNDARKFLERAVEIDSTFASAYLYLALSYGWLTDWTAYTTTFQKARVLSDRVTEKEKLIIEASYARNIEKDDEKRFRILNQLVRKFPREKVLYTMLGDYYDVAGLPYRAIEALHKALGLDPDYGVALNAIAYRYSEVGEYAKAIEYFKRYAAMSPGDANPYDSMGDLYFRMGQLDQALVRYKEALFVKPDFWMSNGKIVYIYALQEDYAEAMQWIDHHGSAIPSSRLWTDFLQKAFYDYLLGKFGQALSFLDTAEYLLQPSDSGFPMALVDGLRGLTCYDQGKYQQSRNHFNACYANLQKITYNTIFYNFCLGQIDIQQNNIHSAKARSATIHSLLPCDPLWMDDHARFLHSLLSAEILFAQDSLEKVIHTMDEALTFMVEWAPGWHIDGTHMPFNKDIGAHAYYRKDDIDNAIKEYEQLTHADPNKHGRSLIRPTWHYELAKLYEEKQLTAKAIEQYEKFLGIWKDADEDRPEKIDARERLDRLKNKRR